MVNSTLHLYLAGRGSAGLARDSDVLLVSDPPQGLHAVAGQAGGVEGGDGGVQREANGAGLQAVGGVVGSDGIREGGVDRGMRGHGPESGGELLSKVPSTGPYSWTEASHGPRDYHTPATGPGGWAPGH